MTKNLAIMLGLVLGLGVGFAAAATGAPPLHAVAAGAAPFGTVFLNLLRLAVIPLVGTTLFTGIATLGDLRQLGRLGARTLGWVWGTTLLAILTGMTVTAVALPFAGPPPTGLATADLTPPDVPGVVEFLVSLIPANAVKAAADGALLPLIVFTALFAAAAATLPTDQKRRLLDLAESITAALVRLVHWILWTAPLGVFGLAAPVAAETGLGLLRSLGVFVVAVLAGLLLFTLLVYVPAVGWARVPLRRFLAALPEPAAIAFTTTSSVATLPAMFEAAESRLALPRPITSFVLPLTAALNRSGSALYQGSAVIFLAHLYGGGLSVTAVGGAVLATFLVALTIAAVPSASVMTLPPALAAVGVPLDGLGMLLGIDRIPDMFRTVVNVTGDMVACVVVRGRAAE
ncbi:MAG: dicarboxylate/amino acid:cation symporter [Gemmatimonadota bacterium]|nr:dicarboxylate/amino acid:cation symporter [Gemmatimonadota bacterium]